MLCKEVYKQGFVQLKTIVPEKEAEQILSILFEDIFRITNPKTNQPFPEADVDLFESALHRLLKLEPVQYVTGKAHFYGYIFSVNKHVLIPRPETEELVFFCLEILKTLHHRDPVKILDVGTGSGIIPITLKKKAKNIRVTAIDIDANALEVAKQNASTYKTEIKLLQLDFSQTNQWDLLDIYDIIISNPPYIDESEKNIMTTQVLDYEPEVALFAPGDDPLYFYKKIFEFSEKHLYDTGYLFLELNEFHSQEIKKQAEKYNFEKIEIEKDMQGKERILICKNS